MNKSEKIERVTDELRAARNIAHNCCSVFKTSNLTALWDLRDGVEAQGVSCKIRREGSQYSLVTSTGNMTICEATEWTLAWLEGATTCKQ